MRTLGFQQSIKLVVLERRFSEDEKYRDLLKQRVECALRKLCFADVRAYADFLRPIWHCGVFTDKFERPAASLSEYKQAGMAACRKFAQSAILDHLPKDTTELRAFVEMMEGDAK
jgi:hypothetical protein